MNTVESILKKKLSNLLDKDLPLLLLLFPNPLDLTKFSKTQDRDKELSNLTKISKTNMKNIMKSSVQVLKGNKNHNKPSKSTLGENNEQLYIKSREKKINNCNTRAGGLAWLRYRLDMAGVVGSNPTRPI